MVSLLIAMALAQAPDSPGRGISEALAAERAAAIRDLRYELAFDVPADRREPVQGRATIRLSLQSPHRLVVDFAQPSDRVRSVRVGGRTVTPRFVDGHIIVPAEATAGGANEVVIEFLAGDDALNRNDEFLYTLFVPARAQLTFPSFDQPDLKARYTLSLRVPDGWQAIANGEQRAEAGADGALQFRETPPLPTYLFSFVAGKFSVERERRGGRELRMFHRETDAAKVARNRAAIFDLHGSALEWLEDYTGIPYPWGKFDIVLIPSFQFGGMEHAGAILYNQSGLMLDESATQNQLLGRASVIAHETSHMWFGDLVTMRWFNDVWMKEVFANFMAAKIVNPSFPQVNHELRFLLEHYPTAYQVDRTAGTNAIRQTLPNLNDAGQMYGPIIYEKAPIVMRQLEMIVGEVPLRDGLREYLKTYAFGNATWLDLVRILDARTPQDLAAWSQAWVEQRGRPEFSMSVRAGSDGKLADISLAHSDPLRRDLVWPQQLRVAVGYPGSVTMLPASVTGRTTTVPGAGGLERPQYVLPNGAGLGYGLFILDDASRTYLLAHIEDIGDALTRGSAWVTLWDNLLEGRVAPAAFLDTVLRALPRETDEQNAQRVLAYASRDVLAVHAGGGSHRADTGTRIDAAGRHRPRPDAKSEGGLVQRLSRYRAVACGARLARPGLAARGKDSGSDPCRARRDRDGAGAGGARRARCGGHPARATRSHRESRPQGALRLRDAGAVGGPGGTRAGVRALPRRRQPPPRAMGAGVAAVPQSPAAGGARAPLRAPGARPAARDSADRRHLLPDAMDGFDALGASLAGGGGDGAAVPRARAAVSGAAALDDPEQRG